MKDTNEEIVVVPTAGKKRSRAQKVDFPTDGILNIVVHIISVNATMQYIKSQRNTSYTLEYASSILNNVNDVDPSLNASLPTITARELHKIVVNFFAHRALKTVDYIANSRGIEVSLLGDGTADFNFSTSSPLFYGQKKRVSLVTDPEEILTVSATVYGNKGSNQSCYSPWTIEAGLLKVSGLPCPLPSVCLGMQIKLATFLSDSQDESITCASLLDIGCTDLVSFIQECDTHNPGTALTR